MMTLVTLRRVLAPKTRRVTRRGRREVTRMRGLQLGIRTRPPQSPPGPPPPGRSPSWTTLMPSHQLWVGVNSVNWTDLYYHWFAFILIHSYSQKPPPPSLTRTSWIPVSTSPCLPPHSPYNRRWWFLQLLLIIPQPTIWITTQISKFCTTYFSRDFLENKLDLDLLVLV